MAPRGTGPLYEAARKAAAKARNRGADQQLFNLAAAAKAKQAAARRVGGRVGSMGVHGPTNPALNAAPAEWKPTELAQLAFQQRERARQERAAKIEGMRKQAAKLAASVAGQMAGRQTSLGGFGAALAGASTERVPVLRQSRLFREAQQGSTAARLELVQDMRRTILKDWNGDFAAAGYGSEQEVIKNVERELIRYLNRELGKDIRSTDGRDGGLFHQANAARERRAGRTGALYTAADQKRRRDKQLRPFRNMSEQAQMSALFADLERAVRENDADTVRGYLEQGVLTEYMKRLEDGNRNALRAVGTSASDRAAFRELGLTRDPLTKRDIEDLELAGILSSDELRALEWASGGKDGGFLSSVTDPIGGALASGAGTLMEFADKGFQELITQPYYASSYRRAQGGSFLDQVMSFGLGLPGSSLAEGLVGSAGRPSANRRAALATNTWEERQELRDAGWLASFGENLVGNYRYNAEARRNMGLGNSQPEPPSWLKPVQGLVSGALDLGLNVAGDPLNILPTAIAKAGLDQPGLLVGRNAVRVVEKVIDDVADDLLPDLARRLNLPADATRREVRAAASQRVAYEARDAYYSTRRVGQNIEQQARAVLDNVQMDVASVSKAMPGLPTDVAAEIAATSRVKGLGLDAAKDRVSLALRTGEYAPSVTLRRQALTWATGRGLNAPTMVGLGPRVIRSQNGLFDVVGYMRRKATGSKGLVTSTWERQSRKVVRSAANAAARKGGVRLPDLAAAVRRETISLRPSERLARLAEMLHDFAGDLPPGIFDIADTRLTEMVPGRLRKSEAFWDDIDKVLLDEKQLEELEDLEVFMAIATGDIPGGAWYGDQLEAEVLLGWEGSPAAGDALDVHQMARKAFMEAGEKKDVEAWRAMTVTEAKNRLKNERFDGMDEVRRALNAELEALPHNTRLALVDESGMLAETLASLWDDSARAHARTLTERYGAMREARQALRGGSRVGLGVRLNPVSSKNLGKLVTSIDETVAPLAVKFISTENAPLAIQARVEAMDAYMGALHLDDFIRSNYRQVFAEVTSEWEFHEAIRSMLRAHANAHDVPEDLIDLIYTKTVDEDAAALGFRSSQDDGALIPRVHDLSQLSELTPLPDPSDINRTMRRLERARGNDKRMEALKFLLENPDTAMSKLKAGFEWTHRTWKLMVVTNLFMPVVGGFAGFVGTDGDIVDRAKGALTGTAIGLLAPARYVVRIGLEETLRRTLARGRFVPQEFIPVLSKRATTRGIDIPMTGANLLGSSDPTGNYIHWRNRVAQYGTGDFTSHARPDGNGLVRIGRGDKKYLSAWHRIIEYQLNEHNGVVTRLAMAHKAGYITEKEMQRQFYAWLPTEEGQIWWRRWYGMDEDALPVRPGQTLGRAEPSDMADDVTPAPLRVQRTDLDPEPGMGSRQLAMSPEDAFELEKVFVDTYVPQHLARMILPDVDSPFQRIDERALKGFVEEGTAPNYVHAEEYWVLPRKGRRFADLTRMKNRTLENFVFGKPSLKFNREPMARGLYRDEYRKLIESGLPKERAAELASQRAVNTTNTIMFNQNNESRFASKVDIVFPFQQAREEMGRVWAPLVLNNKIHTLNVTQLGVLAFENAAASGIFYEDVNPMTGKSEWRMKIPGSASLSRALGGVNTGFDFALKDILFLTQGGGMDQFGVPSVGGWHFSAVSRLYLNAFPEHWDNIPEPLRNYLFPYGASGRIMRSEPSRLWMAMTGRPAPWEFANEWEQEQELERVQREIYLTLYHENGFVAPTDEEVEKGVRAYFLTQATLGTFWPAASRMVKPYRSMLELAMEDFKLPNGELDYFNFVQAHPELQPFVNGSGEYVGPDTFEAWSRSDAEKADDWVKHYREAKPFAVWKKELREFQVEQEAWNEYSNIPFEHPSYDVTEAYNAWEEKWLERAPQVVEKSRNNYFRDQELNQIRHQADGPAKDRAIDQWRRRHNVSYDSYRHLVRRLDKDGFQVNYWRASRRTEDIQREVRRLVNRKIGTEEQIVSNLNPAEQVKYWKWKQSLLDYVPSADDLTNMTDGAQALMDQYYAYSDMVQKVYAQYPKLAPGVEKNPVTRLLNKWRGAYGDASTAIHDEITHLDHRIQELDAEGRKYSAEGNALYKKRQGLYDLAKELKIRQYKSIPGLFTYLEDVKAATALIPDGYKTSPTFERAMRELSSKPIGYGGYVPSNEELGYLNMPDEVKAAYLADLQQQLDLPSQGRGTKGKLFWEWLTPFQQTLLRNNLPSSQIEEWQSVTPEDSVQSENKKGRGRFYRTYSGGGGSGQTELDYAFAMFEQYTKRPKGAKPPAAYAEFLKLPANPVVRNAFLEKHPEVAKWIADGPMANMPEYMRFVVQNIMIKHGVWEGEEVSDAEITDLAWAREQFKRWDRRGDMKEPAAYQKWLAMPTGAAKIEYLNKHPEIKRWLELGPMRSMPDAYQDVVRDIMIRYQQWTDDNDPMSLLIQGYYRTPEHGRAQYLEKHPELADYWAAISGPEDKRLAAMLDQYWSIKDPYARTMFTAMHPEVKEYFVTKANERYEKFLMQVAQYMGQNPSMFNEYLERQEEVLYDLLSRYATPALTRESRGLSDASLKTSKRARRRG